jgi:hypothetical protein
MNIMRTIKPLGVVVAAAVLLSVRLGLVGPSGLAATAADATATSKGSACSTVATVNGQKISMAQAQDLAFQRGGISMVSRLIEFSLLDQECRRQHITVTADDVDARFNTYVQSIRPRTLDQVLHETQMSIDTLTNVLRHDIENERLAGSTDRGPEIVFMSALRSRSDIENYVQAGDTDQISHGVAAMVNGQPISMSNVRALCFEQWGRAVVDELIDAAIVDQACKQKGIVVTDADIDPEIEKVRERVKPQSLELALRTNNMTVAELRDQIRQNLEAQKLSGSTDSSAVYAFKRSLWSTATIMNSLSPAATTP